MGAAFSLEITSQYWLGPFEDPQADACSHGGIRAPIAGTVVTSDRAGYGISQSALALLRTLEQDHTPVAPIVERYLLCHGCGYPIGFGCDNFGTNWVVRHIGDEMVLGGAALHDVMLELHAIRFDVTAVVPTTDYRAEIVAFAQTARDFYFASGQRTVENWEQSFHDAFWAEFDERLERATAAAEG